MASLNLVPNPTILAIQSGVFLASLLVVKHFFLQPYLKLKKLRVTETEEKKRAAETLRAKNLALIAEIEERLQKETKKFLSEAQSIVSEAQHRKALVISEAQMEANKLLKTVKNQIGEHKDKEFKNIANMIPTLSELILKEIYK